MAQSKATKKFERKHLKDTLGRRKDFKKVKQRHQVKDKRKARLEKENGGAEDAEEDDEKESRPPKKQKQDVPDLDEMTVDEFFAGGFEVPEMPEKLLRKAEKSVKRKRTEEGTMEDIVDEDDEMADGSEDGDETAAHRNDLKAMAEKDPEFYKYLQENDPELLDFAENATLAEIDELSDSDEETKDKKGVKEKKQKGKDLDGPIHLTKLQVKGWTQVMVEKYSLRSMQEVVLAFRSAAHVDEEEEGKTYKYAIKEADGMFRIY